MNGIKLTGSCFQSVVESIAGWGGSVSGRGQASALCGRICGSEFLCCGVSGALDGRCGGYMRVYWGERYDVPA